MSEYADEESFMELYDRVDMLEKAVNNILELLKNSLDESRGLQKYQNVRVGDIPVGSLVMNPETLEMETIDKIEDNGPGYKIFYSGKHAMFYNNSDVLRVYEV
jgi:hypothetical protein